MSIKITKIPALITAEPSKLEVIVQAAIPSKNGLDAISLFNLKSDKLDVEGFLIRNAKKLPTVGFSVTDKESNVNGFYEINLADIAIAVGEEFSAQVKRLDIKPPTDQDLQRAARAERNSSYQDIAEKLNDIKASLGENPSIQDIVSAISKVLNNKSTKTRAMKALYPITCPECQHSYRIMPSPSQESGENDGSYSDCDKCDMRHFVKYLPDTDSMIGVSIKKDDE